VRTVVRSGPGPDGVLPVDTAAWFVPGEEGEEQR
jgi:hypothetical protein